MTEVEAVPGYGIDPAARSQTVQVNASDTQTVTFENMPAWRLTVIKTEDGTRERISGVISLPQAEKGW